jgi:GTP pyrophosphokinase/guanosine-3',5'-bis(diphosphate) 3'-pyrophosphohydrolase
VHTKLGDTCLGAKINGELRPLRTALSNGDVVEVVRGAAPAVPPDWEGLTVSARARSAIRRHIRHSEKEGFLRLGKTSLDQIFERAGKVRADVSLRPALDRFAAASENELFEAVGRGRIAPTQVLETVFPGLKETEKEAASARRRIEDGKAARFYVRGAGLAPGVSLRFSPCCNPMPGDRIVGIVGEGDDLAVHTIDCAQLAQYEDHEELWRDLQWTAEAERNTLSAARLHATIRDAPGVLGQTCTVIGEAGGNIVGVNMRHRHSDFFDVDFDVEVKDARHLTHIAAALRACPSVETVERANG